jgi:hypothetical protein
MQHLFLSLFLALTAQSVLAVGPTENSTPRHANAYGSDEKWWKCNALEPSKGCDTGTLAVLGLSKEEEAFVKGKLDRITWRPQKVEKGAVAKILGAEPSVDVGVKQVYSGAGPGSDPNRGVSVYINGGSVFMIHWYLPGRFLLVRASAV